MIHILQGRSTLAGGVTQDVLRCKVRISTRVKGPQSTNYLDSIPGQIRALVKPRSAGFNLDATKISETFDQSRVLKEIDSLTENLSLDQSKQTRREEATARPRRDLTGPIRSLPNVERCSLKTRRSALSLPSIPAWLGIQIKLTVMFLSARPKRSLLIRYSSV